jgi:hypothetical protein
VRGARGTRWAAVVAIHVLAAATADAIQTTIGGRQIDLDATVNIREVIEADRSSTHERTLEQLRLRAAISLAQWLRFDSTTVAANGGPTIHATRSGVYNLHDTFQDVSPSVEFDEAYFDVFLPSVDLRLGKQKVAWGKLDRTQPNDLINTFTYFDPFLQEEAERKIGVPAVQASYYLPAWRGVPAESRLTAVWVPKYVPYRFSVAQCDVQGTTSHCNIERWFPPAAVPPTTFTVLLPPGSPVPAVTVPLSFRTNNRAPPAWRFENSEIGLRYAALVHDADVAFYYFHGFDSQPAFLLTATALGEPSATGPLPVENLTGATVLSPDFKQINSWGADAAYAIDRFTVRAEGAFVQGRPFPRDLRFLVSDSSFLTPQILNILQQLAQGAGSVPVQLPPSAVVRNAVEWGIGSDYIYEGYMLLFQVNQTDVLHNDVNLLIKDVDTRLLANLRKSFFSDTLQTQFVALYGIESSYTLLRPRVLYRFTDHIAAEVGYLFIAGRTQSIIGQYKHNDEGWVRLECKL